MDARETTIYSLEERARLVDWAESHFDFTEIDRRLTIAEAEIEREPTLAAGIARAVRMPLEILRLLRLAGKQPDPAPGIPDLDDEQLARFSNRLAALERKLGASRG